MTAKVWVCENGDYEARCVVCVSTTVEAGIEYIKSTETRRFIEWTRDDSSFEKWGSIYLTANYGNFSDQWTFTLEDLVGSDE